MYGIISPITERRAISAMCVFLHSIFLTSAILMFASGFSPRDQISYSSMP